jgi:cephalosporin-C deacetylase-like acetyl esterase
MRMLELTPEYGHYPSKGEVGAWVEKIWSLANSQDCAVDELGEECDRYRPAVRHIRGGRYVRFSPEARKPFVAYWQPAFSVPAPLLVHTPGYGAEISMHPGLVEQGFSVLAVNPLGYVTEQGVQEDKMVAGGWPVLHDTIQHGGIKGYGEWLADCIIAVQWAWKQKAAHPQRVSFFGTSQGGGGALLLGSLFRGKGARCVAADEPFLTNCIRGAGIGGDCSAYNMIPDAMKQCGNLSEHWHNTGMIDTISHAHRLTLPVLLTAGGNDTVCPPETILSLFDRLPSTRSLTWIEGAGHGYTQEFIQLSLSWFRMFA